MEWCVPWFRNEILEKDFLNELKPHNDSLKQLKIVSYGGIELPTWVRDPTFLRLKHVSIRGCKNCISLPPLGNLTSLKELFISVLDGVKVVGLEFLGARLAFPSLENLRFKDMSGWEKWSTDSGDVFPCLQELHIDNCPNLVEVSLEALPSLRVLRVSECGDRVLRSLVQVASSVIKLQIDNISGLTYEVWTGVLKCIREVNELSICRFNEIRYLRESEVKASKVLVSLRKMEVHDCDNLVSLGEKGEDDDGNWGNDLLTSLRIGSCNNLEHCSCPNSLEKLSITYCTSIKAIFFPTGGWQKLKSLEIYNCNILMEKEFGLININKGSSMPMLEKLWIMGWPNLKSIIEWNYFIHLTELTIEDC